MCCVALVPILLLGDTYKVFLGPLVLKMLMHPLFLFLRGVFIVGINTGLSFGCLHLSFKNHNCAVQLELATLGLFVRLPVCWKAIRGKGSL